MVSHTVAFDTTRVSRRDPRPSRTPVASPSSTMISSDVLLELHLPPNFSSAPTSLSTTACVPPTGAHRRARAVEARDGVDHGRPIVPSAGTEKKASMSIHCFRNGS